MAAKGQFAPAKEPQLRCPFTGAPLEIKFVPELSKYQAVGKFWRTGFYESRSELLWDISQRGGVAPAFSRTPKIVVTERTAPESDPLADRRESMRISDEAAREEAERLMRAGRTP